MIVIDLSAIDKLIDFYGEYVCVKYKNKSYDLIDLRQFLDDSKISFSIYDYKVNSSGILDNNDNLLVEVIKNLNYNKDDLSKI